MSRASDWRWWIFGGAVAGGMAGVIATGYFVGQWGMAVERDRWQAERKAYIERFPKVRQEERASCMREYDAQLAGIRALGLERDKRVALLTQQNSTLLDFVADLKRQQVASDARSRQILQAAQVAAVKANEAAVKQDATAKKVDEAASAAKAVEKKLDTATRGTAAVPPQPWAGGRRP